MHLMAEGVAVIPTSPECTRSRDVLFPFRPDSDFYYLTGFAEPEAVAVLCPNRDQGEFVVFCRERDPERETWEGKRAGLDGAISQFGADDAFPIDDIDEILPGLLENRTKVFCTVGSHKDFDIKLLNWVQEVKNKSRAGITAPNEIVDLGHILHELRLVKRTEEVNVMKRIAKISASAHRRAMEVCRPGMSEYEIAAEIEYVLKKSGCDSWAYPPIVAGGVNACILHYITNRDTLHDGDLLLIDAGGELEYYAADITRTFPVNGKYSGPQKAVYEVVLAAQLAAIDQAQVNRHWNWPHAVALKILVEGLIDLGLLKGSVEDNIEQGNYRRFFMHRTGHWLGMDVHDVGDYKVANEWRILEPGMVITVEPGLYISGDDDIDPRYRYTGIRIEDDVLVQRKGNLVLSSHAPKTIDDIESLMASG